MVMIGQTTTDDGDTVIITGHIIMTIHNSQTKKFGYIGIIPLTNVGTMIPVRSRCEVTIIYPDSNDDCGAGFSPASTAFRLRAARQVSKNFHAEPLEIKKVVDEP